MKTPIHIVWLGGDKRQIYAQKTMHSLNIESSAHLLDSPVDSFCDLITNFKTNTIVILPLPVSLDGIHLNALQPLPLSKLAEILPKNSMVLGGKLPTSFATHLNNRSIRFIDYYNDEFQIANALPTAEGAIAIAIREMPTTLANSKVVVIGYGRIGKILASKLQLLGAKVTVLARKGSDLALARAFGHLAVSIQDGLPEMIFHEGYQVIFNTVPVKLFMSEQIAKFDKGVQYIELASAPGGIDQQTAKKHGICMIQAQSLPGKYSPATAGKILAETVVQILRTEGIKL